MKIRKIHVVVVKNFWEVNPFCLGFLRESEFSLSKHRRKRLCLPPVQETMMEWRAEIVRLYFLRIAGNATSQCVI